MINKANQFKFLVLIALVLGFAWGNVQEVSGQTGDPFAKPAWKNPRPPAPPPGQTPTGATPGTGAPTKVGAGKGVVAKPQPLPPPPVVPMGVPSAQDRINWFKLEREKAANEGRTIPKVTSVLTLNEMSVSGIFKTPRGYAAIVQAEPVGFSSTIYPGDKFFDGQLVAIEENRLIFKKVIKMSNGKFISSEEVKPLRTYSQEEELQGTAPVDAVAKGESKAANAATTTASAQPADPTKPAQPLVIVSPLDEMNRQPVEVPKAANEKGKKGKASEKSEKSSTTKKPAKVAAAKKPAKASASKEQ